MIRRHWTGPTRNRKKRRTIGPPTFDLDHVYGGGPEKSPYLYEGEEGAETFKIGATIPSGYHRDLPMRHGRVLIGDLEDTTEPRQPAVAPTPRPFPEVSQRSDRAAAKQIRALRSIANLLGAGHAVRTGAAARLLALPMDHPARLFCRASCITTFGNTRRNGVPAKSGVAFSIPIEFSLAAFRFGHSMVRNAYRLNCRQASEY